MTTMTHDSDVTAASRFGPGLGFAIVSATAFGLSGALARGLLDAGWTAGAAVTARILIAALVLAVPTALAMRGRWGLLRSNLTLVSVYGVVAVAGCQLCYFYAVDHMEVGVALLIEYTAPVAVIGWLWARHAQRPGRMTVLGAVIAGLGLVLVLDVVGGADVSLVGVLWALGAMACVTVYWLISSDEGNGLPPIVLGGAGLVVGATALLVAGLVGIVPMATSTAEVSYDGLSMPWWAPVLALGLVTAALAYVTGIAASRRLGSRLASFVGLLEVVMALVFAWILLDELPRGVQLLGGVLILAGVVVVKLDEGEAR